MPSPPFVCIAQKGNAMPEQALQVAFEIKTACDEISRRLLRWHWERKPGAHSLDALLEHIAARKQESPDYYDRMPDLTGKTSWQQLDTTLCMRVLLDPETDAACPLDLLGNTAHPSAARHACNAIRTARNEAAHAAVAADGAQAALLFNEAIEALEEGYAGTAFKENELAQYYREAEDYLNRCSEGKPLKARQSSPQNTQQGKAAARTKPRNPQTDPQHQKHWRAAEHLCPQPQHRYKAEPRHSLPQQKAADRRREQGGTGHYSGSAGAGAYRTRHQHGFAVNATFFANLEVNWKAKTAALYKTTKKVADSPAEKRSLHLLREI